MALWDFCRLRGVTIGCLGSSCVVVTIIAYQPAWHAGFIWDDDKHITQPELRSLNGLARIWTQPGATQQYYPLVHSVFWVEHKLWGDATAGYHWVNILLHAFSALLLVKILRQLKIPGAWLAAALFALHPVEVESVAWISELKNTLSGVFYLGAALAYLGFDRNRNGGNYAAGFGTVPAGVDVENRHCHPAGGVAGGFLVATREVILEAGRAAADSIFHRGDWGRIVYRVGGTEVYHWRGRFGV